LGCGDEEGLAFEIDFMAAAVRAAQDSEHGERQKVWGFMRL